jgi:Family of unknown function (DUF6011)
MITREEYLVFSQRPENKRYWQPVAIDPVPTLAEIRQVVLSITEKRCPKWRFRLTDDVVLQLQPKPRPPFVGLILQGPGITKEHFTRSITRLGLGFREIDFDIGEEDGRWTVRVHRGPGPSHDVATWQALKDCLIDALPKLNTLGQALMFQPACMICGKALTDPVSRARWIGPECYGNHALDVGLFRLT